MNKLSVLLALSLLISACTKTHTEDSSADVINQPESEATQQAEKLSLEETFWNALKKQCGSTFIGNSIFPDNPEDSFFGKTLVADFTKCNKSQIHLPFTVGENKSRTWIFSKLGNGKLELKHQHLHDDGSVDEVSNYGGVSDGGSIEINGQAKSLHIHFPADEFTKELIPEASTNIWTIEFIINADSNTESMTYNLYRNKKQRFIAELRKAN